mgnify:FL=1
MSLSLQSAQAHAARILREGGVASPELDARVLLRTATGLTFESMIANAHEPMSASCETRFDTYVARRLAGEPVARIRGVREFYGRDFRINSNTLDPRPDTETVVSAVLDILKSEDTVDRDLRVLDLGTGSGCILITLLAELPQATGVGTDISPGALRLAQRNADSLGVSHRARFVAADWFDRLTGHYDIVVSNPPYIPSSEIEGLAPEVARHDPSTALDGGIDGLDAYRRIAAAAGRFLRPGGALVVEIGCHQVQAVSDIFRAGGLVVSGDAVHEDLAGLPRCISANLLESVEVSSAERAKNILGKS